VAPAAKHLGPTMANGVKNDRSVFRLEAESGAMDPPAEQARTAASATRAALASQIAPPGSAHIVWRVFVSIFEHRVLTTSGGVAFFALLAIFPALATIVSLYSLFADPHAIPERVALLAGVVPSSIIDLIKDEIQSLAERNVSTLSVAFLVGLLVSIWSANSGVSALFDALNVVHDETEERSLLQFYLTTFAVTLGAVVYGLLAIIGVLPIALKSLGLSEHAENVATLFRWPLTLLIVMIWLSIVYRVGPSRSNARWRWVTWGSGLAAILLVAASTVFSWYLAEFNSYDRLYGSLGAVVGFMTWLWISVVVMLLGAELDAALERKSSGRKAESSG
jgi:membrane protein